MAGIRLENVSKVYDHGKIGVQNFHLEVFEKEFVVLVGPSGCGKSTTLRLIAGLEQPSGGRIFIGDRLVNAVPPSERDIAMVFQNYALYPHMTVFENMAFGLKLQKLPKEEIYKRVTDAASLLEMEEYLDRKPKALSGGQRQRAALGRAIVRKPKVFLFDEPLSNLDAKMRLQMRTEISKLHHRLDATMIYVTHDQTEAMSLADRIVLMKDGWIQQIGTPLKLYNHPVNLFSAGFIGSPPMNFLDGTVEKKGRRIFIKFGSGVSFPISESCSARVAASALKTVVAGFRPEDVKLQKGKKAPEEIQMKGTVEVVEHMGSETYLHFTLKQGRKLLSARIDADKEIKGGSEVSLSLDIINVHLFDPETEQVI